MEVDGIQQGQACKFPRLGNGRNDVSTKIGSTKGGSDHYPPDDEEDGGELKRLGNNNTTTTGLGSDAVANVNANRLRGWHNSSRIIRVSRASGGKDRHSKVWTSKGLRDRRVRLSVTTAIQFYDLQDRLGYDQPSKAVEWLIKAAADAISELPCLKSPFPDTPKQLSDEKRASGGTEHGFDSAELELDGDPNFQQNQSQSQHLSLSKSACSSTSETSKGSGLSLSRSEIRVKARERARERAAKEKEKENESRNINQNVNHISHNSTFTELLTGGISNNNNGANHSPTGSAHQNPSGDHQPNLFHKPARQWGSSTPMDYFDSGLLGQSSSSSSRTHHSSGFPGQIHLGNSLPQAMSVPVFNVPGDHHSEMQHFPFEQHLIPVAATSQPGAGDYNLNFTISSGLAGYNRGTLQSNSPSLLPHLQRFSPNIDGSSLPFFMQAAAAAAPPMENHHHHHHHHQFSTGFDGRLQLCYGDATRHSDHKGKGKN